MEEKQKSYLFEAARWEKFLGVLTVISSILVAVLGVFFIAGNGLLTKSGPTEAAGTLKFTYVASGILYLALAVVMQFPAKFLLSSAKSLKSGLVSEDEAVVTNGLKNCKSYLKFTAIYTLVGLAVAAVVLVIAAIVIGLALAA